MVLERRLAPLAITHQGLFPAATISFNVAPGASLSEALDELERDEVIQAGLGPIYPEFLRLKRIEWNDYHRDVSSWEVERYLTML